jgi:hypothetical protein
MPVRIMNALQRCNAMLAYVLWQAHFMVYTKTSTFYTLAVVI